MSHPSPTDTKAEQVERDSKKTRPTEPTLEQIQAMPKGEERNTYEQFYTHWTVFQGNMRQLFLREEDYFNNQNI